MVVYEWLPPVPPPTLISTLAAVGYWPVEPLPTWAAHWLADGHDGDALRTLAGLSGTDGVEVAEVLFDALAECGAAVAGASPVAVSALFSEVARWHLDGGDVEIVLNVVDTVLAEGDFDREVRESPLAGVRGLADEWGPEWGRSRDEIRADVRAACSEQLTYEPK